MSIRRFRYSARMHSDEPASQVGRNMYQLVEELYPICRSITGNGVRATLDTLGRRIPLEVVEVASGTPVLDWTVPLEWNIRDAFIADGSGRARRRLHGEQPPRRQLLDPDRPTHVSHRVATPPALAARAARGDPVSDVVLRRDMGVLSHPAPSSTPSTRRKRTTS